MSDEIHRLKQGGPDAVADAFSSYRERLEHMVAFRMDPRLRGRIDPADVVQEAFIEVARRAEDFLERPDVSFYVWVRKLTYQALINLHRRHFREKRGVAQEVHRRRSTNATTCSIAAMLIAQQTTPGRAAIREEERLQLHDALDEMEEIDREVVALRHFENMGNNEVAEILEISVTAASNRYVRAMTRLGKIMERLQHDA